MREISNFTWTPQVAEQEHKCLLGDSLEGLSLKYGTTVAARKKSPQSPSSAPVCSYISSLSDADRKVLR